MTNWSFLSSASPRTLHLKQRLIENGSLYSVTQLPGGIIPRTLPALLQLGPSEPGRTVRLVNAKDWCVPSRQGLEISYLDPILAQACDRPIGRLPRWTPKPPAENVDYEALILRGCDLRLKSSPLVQTSAPSLREESLGGCAALVRGRCSPRPGTENFPISIEKSPLPILMKADSLPTPAASCRMPRPCRVRAGSPGFGR